MKKIYQIILLFLLIVKMSYATENETGLNQMIRGTVIEEYTKIPLPGATVFILDSDPVIGTTSDIKGNFVFNNIPVGRVSIKVSYMGYKNRIVSNIQVLPTKETVIIVELEQDAIQLKGVNVTGGGMKNEPLNDLTSVSARKFSAEETNKYAGSLGDPARMAGNFAGVLSVDDSRNDIVIRGNSPYGLLWRVDGFDIPNPSHYSMPGSKGGSMSMLNNNNLANSDFITGAFPAEYGNALSGVFDLNLRNGNAYKREHVFQLATSGFELGSEGPIGKNNASSYIFNYRYGAPEIFDILGMWDEPYMPKYQDFTFKANLPNTKLGYFQLFALGGSNSIIQDSRDLDSTDWSYGLAGQVMKMDNNMKVAGLTHTYYFSENTRLVTKVSIQNNQNKIKLDSVVNDEQALLKTKIRLNENKLTYKTILKTKINPKNYFTLGASYEFCNTDYTIKETVYDNTVAANNLDIDESINDFSTYFQYKHKFTNNLSLTLGSRYFNFLTNNTYSIEPRAGIKYNFANNQTLSFGYGIHSQKQSNIVYFQELYDKNTAKYIKTNEKLEMTKSQHFIIGYNSMLSKNLNLKVEAYYQNIWDVPVTPEQAQFSILNIGGAFDLESEDNLINQGTGENYGLEITLEKYLSNNYYFLLTSSLFQSKYKGYDDVIRNTEFNSNYAINALFGYDMEIKEKYVLGFNIRSNYSGGKRELPIDLDASIAKGDMVYDWENAYKNRFPDYFRFDLRISLKEFHKKYSTEFAVDITNLTDIQNNIISRYYNRQTETISTDYQDGRTINFLFKIYF
ncbi:MAG: TonB-dependent receptor [Labilibaculum sp.]|nr:TonB-dependent receptor [Labilibaculum sp.]